MGPSKEGVINPIFEERLLQLGEWLDINGEAIYSTKPWTYQNDSVNSHVWYTSNSDAVYAISLDWTQDGTVVLGSAQELFKSEETVVTLLGNEGKLKWMLDGTKVEVTLPDKAIVKSETAWVLKIKS